MSNSKNKPQNLNICKDKFNNHFIIETNADNDLEDSEKPLTLEENYIGTPHLIEKSLTIKKAGHNQEIADNKHYQINIVEKDSQKNIDKSLEVKTNNTEKKNKFGRKRKGENNDDICKKDNEHDKFYDDNARRKVKRLIFSHLLKYINKQIKIKYNGKIGNGIFRKELLTLKQGHIANVNATYNKLLLKKTLFEIYSEKISGKITTYPEDHNKYIIKELINEKDNEKRIYFQNLFKLTFSDCLEYLRGDKYFEQLNGLELFSEFKEIKQDYLKKYNDGEEYVKLLKYYIKEYECLINRKNSRKSSKKRRKNII